MFISVSESRDVISPQKGRSRHLKIFCQNHKIFKKKSTVSASPVRAPVLEMTEGEIPNKAESSLDIVSLFLDSPGEKILHKL